MDTANPELQLARDFVRHTCRNIFLTGKAGTGKTTFLRELKRESPKRMIVTAPTGVAAINAGGVTLHSFFQLPLGLFVPGGEVQRQMGEHRLNRQKLDIIKSLDLLVIDEISMVRCDLLDAVDFVLRRHRRSDLPFGGVQLLMIGDLHQLSPVVRDEDWAILRDYYDTGYFFSSTALRGTEVVSIELKHIYRQSDADFIALLNRVRENRLDAESLELLGSRYRPDFTPQESEGYITLTTHNRGADQINETRLRTLPGKAVTFKARIEGEYPAQAYPTSEALILKPGAQVMFVRNDSAETKRYFNGKIGVVTRLERDRIRVRCAGEEASIEVEPALWENIKYTIDPQTKAITEEVIGSFVQFPLRLAWAITIHKSQGLTFERAIIDAGAAFSPGQVYVALSRCKTFEGIVLSSPISPRAVKTDATVSQFVGEATRNPPTQAQLDQARIGYQQRLLQECWDFRGLGSRLGKLAGLLRANRNVLELRGAENIDELERQTRDAIVVVGGKFQRQLHALYREDRIPEEDDLIQERVRKASAYFSEQLNQGLAAWLRGFAFETDNKALRKTLRQAVEGLRQEVAAKGAVVESCRDGFSASAYLSALAQAEIDAQSPPPLVEQRRDFGASETGDGDHPELLQMLRKWREQKVAEEEAQGEIRCQALNRTVLRQIAQRLPDSPTALVAIQGIGKRSVKRYGEELLAIIADYCRARDIDRTPRPLPELIPEHLAAEWTRPDEGTRQISYRLYREGLSIEEIAVRRSLQATTIEGHLAHFIEAGELAVAELVSPEKIERITAAFAELGFESLKEVMAQLGEGYSYGELKMVRAHLQRAP